jgi:rare lipoprotein A
VLTASAAATPAFADDTGGVAPGQPMLVAAPALVGQQQHINGSLGTAAAGHSVEIQAQAGGADWSTIATTSAAGDGSFQVSWRATTIGRWAIRAQLAGDAVAAQSLVTPSATATVYRGATATWYSQPGNRTACGVRMRRSTIGVAHRTLPCGTLVDVTWGGRSITVPVIDRGPFVSGVHYDLTLAAARTLGFVSAGRVRVGVLPAGATIAPSPIAAILPAGLGGGVTASR